MPLQPSLCNPFMEAERAVFERLAWLRGADPLAERAVEKLLGQMAERRPREVSQPLAAITPEARLQVIASGLGRGYLLRHSALDTSFQLTIRAVIACRHCATPAQPASVALWCAGLAFLANLLRIQGKGPAALRCLRRARAALAGVSPAEAGGVPALLASFEGTVLGDYRHFGGALEQLREAARRYQAVDADHAAGLACLSIARVQAQLGHTQAALDELVDALPLLQGSTDPVLLLTIDHMYTTFLTDLGELDLASLYYSTYEWRYEAVGEELFSLRGLWIKARLALRCGGPCTEGAAGALREVREGFAERGLAYDAALAGLDQALALARLERHDEVMALAEEMVPIFDDQGIEREARQALLQWADAARAKQADEATVQATLDRLTDLSRRPRPLE